MKVRFGGAFLILALAGCQKAAEPVSRGQAYFNAYGCAQCHKIGDAGGTYGPDLTLIGFRKTSAWLDQWLKNPHAWRAQTVMPNFNLPANIREDLVAYLSTQKGQAWAQNNKPWDHPDLDDPVRKGAVIFDRAGCIACHAQNGRGGYPNNNVVGEQIPALTKVFEGYTKEELLAKIRNGVTPVPADPSAPAPMISMPQWGDYLTEEEISSVADYLISLGKSSGENAGW